MFIKYKLFIFSSDPDNLVTFYRDTLGMKVVKKLEYPKDYGYMLEVAPGYELWIGKHSEIHGNSLEPVRLMLNIYCDEIEKYHLRLKKAGVAFIQEPESIDKFIPGDQRTVCTFQDPEGNCLQFMGKYK